MPNYLLIILLLCLLVVPVYFKATRFDGFWGILMFVLGLSALFLRLSILKNYPFLGSLNKGTINESVLLEAAPTAVFVFFGIYSGHFWRRIKRLEKLVLPYILFGGLQQIFFFWVFSDVIYYLTRDFNFVFIVSIALFIIIHLNFRASVRKYLILLVVFAIINTWIYLVWGNIFPQILVHGLLGSILFTEFSEESMLKKRGLRG